MMSYWGFVGVLINDLHDFTLPCTASELACSARTGDTVIKALHYSDRDPTICLLVLLIMTSTSLCGAYPLLFSPPLF